MPFRFFLYLVALLLPIPGDTPKRKIVPNNNDTDVPIGAINNFGGDTDFRHVGNDVWETVEDPRMLSDEAYGYNPLDWIPAGSHTDDHVHDDSNDLVGSVSTNMNKTFDVSQGLFTDRNVFYIISAIGFWKGLVTTHR